ncbi:exopolysaccharide production repressor protein [Ollibium composti]|uniref:Exopolysaccharide production repressor protein exox n=1 Tax=Ollibium composti TaxID=2675109 RepID=A0ABY2Q2I9_9HYPH|nr:exopolysaccharide production repressor protein [Mesorhizobium composti]THF55206.1 exopolysaccharide production repressor protein exox [Mesorhizobium composti]
MPFVLFLRGFIGALVAFAIVTYVVTQSLWTTLIDTIICAVIIQAGYFLAVLAMIWWAPARGKASEPARKEPAPAAAKKDRQVVR